MRPILSLSLGLGTDPFQKGRVDFAHRNAEDTRTIGTVHGNDRVDDFRYPISNRFAYQNDLTVALEPTIPDINGLHDEDGLSLFVPRAMISMAARATKRIPIDTVHIDVHNLDDLEKNLKLAKSLGFEGMLVLHPKEIQLVHKYFSPSDCEKERATKMLQLSEEAEQNGKGVAVLDGTFIGPPLVKSAKNVLYRAKLIESRGRK